MASTTYNDVMAPPPGAVNFSNGVWLDASGNPIQNTSGGDTPPPTTPAPSSSGWSIAKPQPWGQVPYNQTYGGHTLPFTSNGDQIWNALQKAGVGLSMPQFTQGNQFLGNMAPRYAFGLALKDSRPDQGTLWEHIGTPAPTGIRVGGTSPGGYPQEYNTGDPYGNFQWMNNMGMNSGQGQVNGSMGMPNQIQPAGAPANNPSWTPAMQQMQQQAAQRMFSQQQPQAAPGTSMPTIDPMNPTMGGGGNGQGIGQNPTGVGGGDGVNAGGYIPQAGGSVSPDQATLFNLSSMTHNPGQYNAVQNAIQAGGGVNAATNNSIDQVQQGVMRQLMQGANPAQLAAQYGQLSAGDPNNAWAQYADPARLNSLAQMMSQYGMGPGSQQAPAVRQPWSGQGARRGILGTGNL